MGTAWRPAGWPRRPPTAGSGSPGRSGDGCVTSAGRSRSPASPATARRSRSTCPARAGGRSVSGVRVMVVDDHPMWREGVARDLAEAGYEVVAVVGEGRQALRLAPAVRPDVVVL